MAGEFVGAAEMDHDRLAVQFTLDALNFAASLIAAYVVVHRTGEKPGSPDRHAADVS